jgi:hypothetical protein
MKRVIAALLLLSAPVQAQVSSTAAPVANSSGSVTNQNVNVNPTRSFEYRYGAFHCQGTSLQISPFVSNTIGWATPYEAYYPDPVYDTQDLTGGFDSEGNPIPDGRPDRAGEILFYKPVRTGQKTNFSLNTGITATFSIPLDRRHVRACQAAAEKQVALLDSKIAEQRLIYEIKRIKNCADLLKDGIVVRGVYAQICKDVSLTNPPGVLPPHNHPITFPKPVSDREWLDSGDAAKPAAAVRIPVSPYGQASD